MYLAGAAKRPHLGVRPTTPQDDRGLSLLLQLSRLDIPQRTGAGQPTILRQRQVRGPQSSTRAKTGTCTGNHRKAIASNI